MKKLLAFKVAILCTITWGCLEHASLPPGTQTVDLDVCITFYNGRALWLREGPTVFRSVSVIESLADSQGCDLVIQGVGNSFNAHSAYTKRVLYAARRRDSSDFSVMTTFNAFRENSPLYRQVLIEREEFRRSQEARQSGASPGLSKGELKEIVKAAVEGAAQAQKKEPEAQASIVSDVDKPTYQSPENPNNFAIVIGIEKYSEVPEAQFAERDAETVKNHLLASGYPRRNIVHLSGEKAGRAAIEKFLETWLPRNVNEHSRVFFYFSGHGAPDVETKQAYLVPWDGDPKFLENTAYPVKRLYEKLNSLPAKEVVVALDTCFSGLGGRSVVPKGSRPMGLSLESPLTTIGRLIVFTASGNDEISGSEDTQGHGLFTYYFLKGLNGATKEPGGHITVKGLHNFLSPEVQNEARRQNRSQTPQLLSPNSSSLATLNLR